MNVVSITQALAAGLAEIALDWLYWLRSYRGIPGGVKPLHLCAGFCGQCISVMFRHVKKHVRHFCANRS